MEYQSSYCRQSDDPMCPYCEVPGCACWVPEHTKSDGTAIDGDIEAFFRMLETDGHEAFYERRVVENQAMLMREIGGYEPIEESAP